MTAASGIALFDVDIWCASHEWLYTDLTRTNDLDKVVFWDPAAGAVGDQPVVMRSDLSQAMEAKLRGYMDQDMAAGRAWAARGLRGRGAHHGAAQRPGGRVRALRCVAAAQVEACRPRAGHCRPP